MLWPKFETSEVAHNLAFTGTIKQDVIDEVEIAFYLIKYLKDNEKEKLYNRYNLSEDEVKNVCISEIEEENILNIMHLIGKKRGAILSGGKIDETKISKIILDDFQSGRIGKITLEKVK